MDLDEFITEATSYAHAQLLEGGGKGLRMAIRDIILDSMHREAEKRKNTNTRAP